MAGRGLLNIFPKIESPGPTPLLSRSDDALVFCGLRHLLATLPTATGRASADQEISIRDGSSP